MIVNKYYKVIRVLKDGGDGPTPFYLENVDTEAGTFRTQNTNIPFDILYKLDDGEWFPYTSGSNITVPAGSRIYLVGNYIDTGSVGRIYLTKGSVKCKVAIGGYLTSLLQSTNFDKVDTIPNGVYSNMFTNAYAEYYTPYVVSAKNLITNNIKNVGDSSFSYFLRAQNYLAELPEDLFDNLTNVSKYSFQGCFSGSTSLTTLPEGMFSSVTNLALQSFERCFTGCTSLTTLPEGMFSSVTSTANQSFIYCFDGCTSLTTLPTTLFANITSTSSYAFWSCFKNCTSLLVGPNFKNITGSTSHDAFDNCFEGCSNLQLIYAPSMSSWNESYFQDWVKGVYPTGKMYVKSGVVPPMGTSGVPEGWQLLNY